MSDYPHLRNAPIVEALIDIQVGLPPEVSTTDIGAISEKLKDYPEIRHLRGFTIGFRLGQSPGASHSDEHLGYRFESADGRQVVQVRRDGFTFSKLKKYDSWEEIRSEAYRLWNLYYDIAKPTSLNRIAVRFINQMNLGLPLEEYLVTPPKIPPNLSGDVTSFLSRIVIVDKSLHASAIITQGLKAIEGNGSAPIILDIDVFKEPTSDVTSEEAWRIIDSFHDFKNRLFFESITDKTKALYK